MEQSSILRRAMRRGYSRLNLVATLSHWNSAAVICSPLAGGYVAGSRKAGLTVPLHRLIEPAS